MQCAKCGNEIDPSQAFDVGPKKYCTACFMEMAQSIKPMSSDERQRLKKLVQQEMAGVLPREALREAIEDGWGSILKGADFDDEVNRLLNRIDQQAGLHMCQEVLTVILTLQKTLREQEAELREKIRRLADLQ